MLKNLLYIFGLLILISACSESNNGKQIIVRSNQNNYVPKFGPDIQMDSICDAEIERVANQILESADGFDKLSTFLMIDSGTSQIHEAHLLSYLQNELTITINGSMSCLEGCTGKLLMIFDEELKLMYVETLPSSVRFIDYNLDGQHEIYSENLIVWNNTCYLEYSLQELGDTNYIFYQKNYSPATCMLSPEASKLESDTILHESKIQFMNVNEDKKLEIVRETKIKLFKSQKVFQMKDTIHIH